MTRGDHSDIMYSHIGEERGYSKNFKRLPFGEGGHEAIETYTLLFQRGNLKPQKCIFKRLILRGNECVLISFMLCEEKWELWAHLQLFQPLWAKIVKVQTPF